MDEIASHDFRAMFFMYLVICVPVQMQSQRELPICHVFYRLLSLSFGLSSANMEMWNKAKAMEVMRKQRVAQLPTSTQQRPS